MCGRQSCLQPAFEPATPWTYNPGQPAAAKIGFVSLDLASDRNQLEIEYAGVGLTAPESLRYQYRLYNARSEPTDQQQVNFASLPSGHHRFEVTAVDGGPRQRRPVRPSRR
jgi:hypothetical protein